jgi:hypothetical protein
MGATFKREPGLGEASLGMVKEFREVSRMPNEPMIGKMGG